MFAGIAAGARTAEWQYPAPFSGNAPLVTPLPGRNVVAYSNLGLVNPSATLTEATAEMTVAAFIDLCPEPL